MNKKFLANKVLALTIILLFIVMSSVSAFGDIETKELSKHTSFDLREKLNTDPSECVPHFIGMEGENGWFIGDVTILFEYDPAKVKTIWYRITSEEWIEFEFKPVIFSLEGEYPFEYYWEDHHNNTFYPSTSEHIRIDKIPPTIQLNSQVKGWKKNKIKFTAKVNDGEKGSGIDRVEFYLDDELVATLKESPYEYLYTDGEEGHPVEAIVYDFAGHSNSDDTITESISLHAIYLGKILQRLSFISQIIFQIIRVISPFTW